MITKITKGMTDMHGLLDESSPFDIIVVPFSFVYDDGKFFKTEAYPLLKLSRSFFKRKRDREEYVAYKQAGDRILVFIDDICDRQMLQEILSFEPYSNVAFCEYYGRSYVFRNSYRAIVQSILENDVYQFSRRIFHPTKGDELENRNNVHYPLG